MEEVNNASFTIDDLNRKQIQKLVVPLSYLVILAVVGIPGNLIVFIIYRKRYAKCVYRTVIRSLALVDLVFCLTAIPFNIGRLIVYYTFTELWLCKAFTSIIIFYINYSAHLLLVLSVHRFLQVCRPLKSQITNKTVFRWICICFFVSVLYTLPHPFLQPLKQVSLENNLTGHICPVSWEDGSVYLSVYNAVQTGLFVIYSAVLFTIYSLIGRTIYRRRRKTADIHHTVSQTDGLSSKMTKIAFTISSVFALSYVPLFVIKLAAVAINENELNKAQFILLKLVERSYLINHVANPFIYAIFDQQFRQQFRNITYAPCSSNKKHSDIDLESVNSVTVRTVT